jgi:hypothetical protein
VQRFFLLASTLLAFVLVLFLASSSHRLGETGPSNESLRALRLASDLDLPAIWGFELATATATVQISREKMPAPVSSNVINDELMVRARVKHVKNVLVILRLDSGGMLDSAMVTPSASGEVEANLRVPEVGSIVMAPDKVCCLVPIALQTDDLMFVEAYGIVEDKFANRTGTILSRQGEPDLRVIPAHDIILVSR